MNFKLTEADVQNLKELREDLRQDHEKASSCGRGCKRYACAHTMGGYEIGSDVWATRCAALTTLDAILEQERVEVPHA